MHVPSADELAAIAAAYVAVTAAADAPAQRRRRRAGVSPGDCPTSTTQRVRFAAASASRWNAAGRLDG